MKTFPLPFSTFYHPPRSIYAFSRTLKTIVQVRDAVPQRLVSTVPFKFFTLVVGRGFPEEMSLEV